MSIVLCTLALNEIEWLPRLYAQHKNWPELECWVFVEAADRTYADTNPELVSPKGLSVDGTSEFLAHLAAQDSRVRYVQHGFSSHVDPAQGKCEARQRYLDEAELVKPEFLGVVDADEYYSRRDQRSVLKVMRAKPYYGAYVLRHREIWRPPSLADSPLFRYEVVGGFWDIPYCRFWRWRPGLRYVANHNTPEYSGVGLDQNMLRLDRNLKAPYCVHLGFASNPVNRLAKNRYYQSRGEGVSDHRGWYVQSRAAWLNWRLGDPLPKGAHVIPYSGAIPEVFKE